MRLPDFIASLYRVTASQLSVKVSLCKAILHVWSPFISRVATRVEKFTPAVPPYGAGLAQTQNRTLELVPEEPKKDRAPATKSRASVGDLLLEQFNGEAP